MIATSLAAALALLAPAPESLVAPQTPYSAVAPQGSQARTLNDQDTALFRQAHRFQLVAIAVVFGCFLRSSFSFSDLPRINQVLRLC